VIAGFVANVAGGAVLGVVVALAFGADAVASPRFLFAAMLAGQLFLFAFALGYLRWRSRPVSVDRPSRSESVVIGASVVASVAAALGLTLLRRTLLSGTVTSTIDGMVSTTPTLALALGVSSVLLIAPAEELLFRGAIQGLLKRAWGPWPAILAAGALFGSLHLFGGASASTLAYVVIAFLLGSVLGVLYEYTENLVVPAAAHGLFNAVAFGIQYLSVTG